MSYRIDREDGILVLRARGDFDLDEVRASLAECATLAAAEPVGGLLIEDTSTFRVAAQDVQSLVALLEDVLTDATLRAAVVVPSDVQFGIGRMVATYCDERSVPFRAFRTEDEARTWLASDAGSSDQIRTEGE